MKITTKRFLNFIYPLAIAGSLLLVTTGCSDDDNGQNPPDTSTLTTASATNITETTATCGGSVTSDGGSSITVYGICWGTTPNPTIANDTTINGTSATTFPLAFTRSITGLTANTTYYVRAYATNGGGTAYGAQETFKTIHPIAYVSEEDGNKEIYVMNTDESGTTTRLTNNSVEDDFPAWSPDGTKIAFASKSSGNWDIWVMNADGSGTPTQVTTNSAEDNNPSWSPDGQWIVFSSRREGNSRIHKIPATSVNESTAPTILGDYPTAGNDYFPSWSSDNKIVFSSSRQGSNNIYVMDPNGVTDTLKDNTANPIPGVYPSWSPNGNQIAYQSSGNIWKADYSGGTVSNQTQLTTNASTDSDPSWSPDGTKIAFMSNKEGNNAIYVMNANTVDSESRITELGTNTYSPAW